MTCEECEHFIKRHNTENWVTRGFCEKLIKLAEKSGAMAVDYIYGRSECVVDFGKGFKLKGNKIRESDHRCKGGFGTGIQISMIRPKGGGLFRQKLGWSLCLGGPTITVEYCPFCGRNLEEQWKEDHP